jgi:hypothetical protein
VGISRTAPGGIGAGATPPHRIPYGASFIGNVMAKGKPASVALLR